MKPPIILIFVTSSLKENAGESLPTSLGIINENAHKEGCNSDNYNNSDDYSYATSESFIIHFFELI